MLSKHGITTIFCKTLIILYILQLFEKIIFNKWVKLKFVLGD